MFRHGSFRKSVSDKLRRDVDHEIRNREFRGYVEGHKCRSETIRRRNYRTDGRPINLSAGLLRGRGTATRLIAEMARAFGKPLSFLFGYMAFLFGYLVTGTTA